MLAACALQPTIRGHGPWSATAGGARPHSPHAADRLIRCNGFDPCGSPSGLIEVVCPWHVSPMLRLARLCSLDHARVAMRKRLPSPTAPPGHTGAAAATPG